MNTNIIIKINNVTIEKVKYQRNWAKNYDSLNCLGNKRQ